MNKITKLLAASLAIIMVVCIFASCGKEAEPAETEPADVEITDDLPGDTPIDGGLGSVSPVITDELKEVVEKANNNYTPVAYVASQVVAGTNHLVLCTTDMDGTAQYVLVKIYEDLEGNAEVIEEMKCDAEPPVTDADGNVLPGGYSAPETPEVTDAAKDALAAALEQLEGADYEAIALLGEQVVAGTNYKLLCKVTAVDPGAEASYAIVTVYADLDGNAKISEVVDFNA